MATSVGAAFFHMAFSDCNRCFSLYKRADTLFSPDLRQENAKVVNGMSRNILSASVSMLLDYGRLHSHATRLGVLDIGSNTVHMLIVDAAPGPDLSLRRALKAPFA